MPMLSPAPAPARDPADRMVLTEWIPFVLAHVACLAAIWTGVHWVDVAIFVVLYALRMFAITAGYHRYFSHRSFKTGRVFAFVLGFLAQSSAQRGVLWWAANHRHHHRHSDTPDDVHSPVQRGFWHSHVAWFFTARFAKTDIAAVPDLAKYPELRWLDRHPYLPPIVLGTATFAVAGWSGLVVGFLWSTVALWHATFSINSLAHVFGRARYVTGDYSRNNWWLAILTFGEGWHNNHHHFQSAARQGFRWWEVDFSYYALKALAAVGIVWGLRTPPAEVVRNEQKLGRAVVERAALHLAASFQAERIAADLRASLAEKGARLDASVDELRDDLARIFADWQHRFDDRMEAIRHALADFVQAVELPAMPTVADLSAKAGAMFAATPSMNDIVERARQLLIESACRQVLAPVAAPAPARNR